MRRLGILLAALATACSGEGGAATALAAPAAAAKQAPPGQPARAPGAVPAAPVGRWTLESLAPPGGGPFDYPALAVRDGRVTVALTTLGGGSAFLGRREPSGWQFTELAARDLASMHLAFDAQGALQASARRVTISPIGTEVLSGRGDAGGLTFEERATSCEVVPGSHWVGVTGRRVIQSYACGRTTVVAERAGSGWRTVATLDGLDLVDLAIAPDGALHAAARVSGTPRTDHVTIRGRDVSRRPLAASGRVHVAVAPDGAVLFAYDRLAPGLSGDREIVLVTRRGDASSEETVGEGIASSLVLDAGGRPIVLSTSMLELTVPRVYLRGASGGWTTLPFAEERGDTVVHDAQVDAQRRLHVVYAWTGASGRVVRYAVVRLPP